MDRVRERGRERERGSESVSVSEGKGCVRNEGKGDTQRETDRQARIRVTDRQVGR